MNPRDRSTVLEQLTREFTLAWRRIRAAPGPAVFAVVTLALGIGVTVATYSVVYTALWSPLGIADPDRLVLLARSNSIQIRSTNISRQEYDALTNERRGFGDTAAWTSFAEVLSGHGTGELIQGEAVTGGYFKVLGVEAALGRTLGPADDRSGAAPVAVLAHSTWRDQFGADRAIVGKSVKIAGREFTVVGIAPSGFRGVHADGFAVRAAWVPLAHAPGEQLRDTRAMMRLTVGLRLGPHQMLATAAEDAAAIGQVLNAIDATGRRNWTAIPITDDLTVHGRDAIGRLIVGLPGLVLLIACTNLANLVLSRGAVRRQEFGVRRALGAPRWRLIREQLVEQAGIALVGGVAGVLVAQALVSFAERTARDLLGAYLRRVQVDWSLDAGVLAATGVAVLVAIVVAGVIPALHLTRDSLRSVMDHGGAGSTPRWRGRANLIAVQVGVSVGLFLIAVVFVRMLVDDRTFSRMRENAPASLERLAVATIPFGIQPRTETQQADTLGRLLTDLRSAPDVADVAVTSRLAFDRWFGRSMSAAAVLPDAPTQEPLRVREFAVASPDLFRVLDLPLHAGRSFDEGDTAASPLVAVINEGLALDLFGRSDIVGRQVTILVRDGREPQGLRDMRAPQGRSTGMTVVGVLSGGAVPEQSGRRATVLYVPATQQHTPNLFVVARGHDGRPAPVDTLRATIKRIDPELAIEYVSRADRLVAGPVAFVGQIVVVLSVLAVLALGLSMTGLYGVLAHVVACRSREMGIRMALGAERTRIVRLVLKDGFRPILEGLFIGLATATVIRVYLKSAMMAAEIAPLDPVACVAAAVLVAAAGALACYLPARRAASVDPNIALRNL